MFNTIGLPLIKIYINNKFKRYGSMLNLNLDSKNKKINLEVMLVGEKESLSINIGEYKILQENDKFYIQIDDVSTSRTWLNVVATETLNGQKLELPSKIAKLLKVIV